jgi:hypothetical protein
LVDKQAECDRWHEAADKWQLVSSQQGMTLEKILTNVELTTHAIVDIRELAQPHRAGAPVMWPFRRRTANPSPDAEAAVEQAIGR